MGGSAASGRRGESSSLQGFSRMKGLESSVLTAVGPFTRREPGVGPSANWFKDPQQSDGRLADLPWAGTKGMTPGGTRPASATR